AFKRCAAKLTIVESRAVTILAVLLIEGLAALHLLLRKCRRPLPAALRARAWGAGCCCDYAADKDEGGETDEFAQAGAWSNVDPPCTRHLWTRPAGPSSHKHGLPAQARQ